MSEQPTQHSTQHPTPGQTIGPFFGLALPYAAGGDLVAPDAVDAVRLVGRVLDGAGDPVPDALLELWQADPAGRVVTGPGSLARDGSPSGWGRAATDPEGRYRFTTRLPGPVDGGAPFLALVVMARGLTDRLFTRIYAPDVAPDADALLRSLDDERRATLVAHRDEHGLVHDIRLQGAGETVFLTYPRH